MKRQLFFLAVMCSLTFQAYALYSDAFDAASLSSRWNIINLNPSGVVSLVDGQLFLKASALNGGSDLYSRSNYNAPRVIQLTKSGKASWSVTTRLRFNPTSNYQSAGIGLLMEADVNNPAAYVRFIELKFSPNEGGRMIGGPQKTLPYTESVVYLRCDRSTDSLRVWFSPTSSDWISLGAIATQDVYGVGLHCIRQPWDGNSHKDSEAFFDYFNVEQEGGDQPEGNDSQLPFVFHQNFDTESQSYVSFFKMNARGTYTGVSGRYGQYLPERTVSLEEFDRNGKLSFSKVIARRPAGSGIGDFNCATADFESDGSMYLLFNNYIPGQEWNSVMKLNAAGDSVWEVMVSEKWQWSAIVMPLLKTYPSGGFVVAGRTNGFPSKQRVNRYSGSGDLLWSQDVFTNDYGYNKFQAVAVNGSGSIFVGGIVHHNLNSRQSALVAKVDTAGAIEWQKVLYSGYLTSGDSLMGEITTLLPTADGGCIAGGFESAKGKWGGWAMLHKFSEAGEIQWTKRYFYTGNDFQDAKVIGLSALPSSNNFMVYAHRDWGNTSAGATLMECTEQGDSLWSQVDYDYRFQFSGVDPTGNVLMIAGAPYAPTNWNSQRFYLRATPDGLFRTPELIYPFANYSDISYKPRFEWVKTGHLQTKTHLQVAHDSLFTNLIAENKAIDGTTFEQLVLPSNTVCYFRVREVGIKGFPGSWSEVRKFTTEVRTVTDATNYKPITATYDKSLQQLRIISSDELLLSKATLFDSTGRLCGCFSFDTTNPAVISIKEFRQGVYILKLTMSDFKETTLKVIIN